MGALSLPSIYKPPKRTTDLGFSGDPWRCSSLKSGGGGKNIVYCQSGGGSSGGGGGSTLVVESGGSIIVTPNENKNSNNIAMKDLVPFDAPTKTPPLVDHMNEDGIGIVNFIRGKSFLITGATGFLAKVLIEKILRTVPDVGTIFLLIKAKNKEAAMARLENEIINAELFKILQKKYGKSYQDFMLSKLVPVVGNVCESNLGIEEDMAKIIAKDVDIIVNSAANTTFDERYDVSLDINTGGPSRLISFAKKFRKLNLFLQVSTAYVNGQRQGKIMEKPFNQGDSIARESLLLGTQELSVPLLDVEDEIKLVFESKQSFEDKIAILAQRMKELGSQRAKKYGWQDTYVFTKAMGEMLIDNMRGEIPVVIIRPSVIESTYKEPFPGWMEGNRMIDPVILYYGKGQLSGFLADPNGVIDVVPADMVVNATLAAMAKHGAAGKSESNIYQVTSSVVNPLAIQDLATLLYDHFNTLPCVDSNGRPIHVPAMKLFDSMEDFSSHLWRDAINRSGLATMASPNGKLSRKIENICKKLVEQAKYLASIYEPYAFYGGRSTWYNESQQDMCQDLSNSQIHT
ncbi:hypothetical protein LguiA_014524 [Lonicera macranthoides]